MRPILASQYPLGLRRNSRAALDVHNTTSNTPYTVPNDLTPPNATQGYLPEQVHPNYSPAQYGDGQLQLVVYAAAGNQLVLPRPSSGQRVLLIIVNDIAGFNIRVNFDTPANVTVGLPIPPGGNLFFDNVIAQNDIHVFAPVAGNIQVAFMNLDVHNASRLV